MLASEILLTIESDTKKEEENILRGFITRLEYNNYTVVSSECPDFELHLKGNCIGVEVTKYYSDYSKSGSKTHQKIVEWKRYAEKFKEILEKIDSSYNYLYGAIHFLSKNNSYKSLFTREIIDEFILLIKNNKLNAAEKITVAVEQTLYPRLGRYVSSIFLVNTYPDTNSLWWDASLQSGSIMKSGNAFRYIVERKNFSSKKYKPDYFQKWLIIYAGGTGLHDIYVVGAGNNYRQGKLRITEIIAPEATESEVYTSDYFTHIFLWDKFTEIIYQYYPYYKKIFDYGEKKIYVNHLPLKNSAPM